MAWGLGIADLEIRPAPLVAMHVEPLRAAEPERYGYFGELAFRVEARRFFGTGIPQSIRDKVAEGEGG